jgi:cytoskeletal protein RodZ
VTESALFSRENLTYQQGQSSLRYEVQGMKGKNMRILIMTAITAAALPFMAVGQTTEEPQQAQGQTKETKETQTTAPSKGKKMRPAQEQSTSQTKPETGTNVRGQTNTNVKGRAHVNETKPGTRSSTSQTNVNTNQTTTVNKEEFRTRHSEVFSLGRHPKEFFVQRYGASHFRMIGNSYFIFLDGCWVAVDVDGFTYTQRVICQGDPDFVIVE